MRTNCDQSPAEVLRVKESESGERTRDPRSTTGSSSTRDRRAPKRAWHNSMRSSLTTLAVPKQFADIGVPVVLRAADSAIAARGKNDKLIPTGPAGRILRRPISSTFPAFAASIPVANAHYFSDDWRLDLEVVLGLIEAHRPEHILVGHGGPLHSDAAKRRLKRSSHGARPVDVRSHPNEFELQPPVPVTAQRSSANGSVPMSGTLV